MRIRALYRRTIVGSLAAAIVLMAGIGTGAAAAGPPDPAQSLQSLRADLAERGAQAKTDAYETALAYVVQFYPLWFTYYQSFVAATNRLVGPVRISPIYKIVVAINDDTSYASTFLDLTEQPVIVTVPPTEVSYSLLTLDPFGNIFDSGVPPLTPGTYGLTGPGYVGTLPSGVTHVPFPYDFSTYIYRADKYSASNEDQRRAADLFRRALRLQTLCDYLHQPCPDGKPNDPNDGRTLIVPEIATSPPFKQTADFLATSFPIRFLGQLQNAVGSARTPPLTTAEQALSDRFDSLFNGGKVGPWQRAQLARGTRAAHRLIVDTYLSHRGDTNWVHFTNIGAWGDNAVERSSITEFIQYGNGIDTAAYYHAFRDEKGRKLDGTDPRGYTLKFSKDQIPQAKRFWSITAYTPDAIELVRNPADKYVVARYTPGLEYDQDGSLTVYLARTPPVGKPKANWLAIPRGKFNIMLRVYGPEGSVADDTYLPPGIQKRS